VAFVTPKQFSKKTTSKLCQAQAEGPTDSKYEFNSRVQKQLVEF